MITTFKNTTIYGVSLPKMSDPPFRLIATREKEKEMTKAEMTIRYNELMRIAKGDEFMSMTEFEELLALTKKLAK